MVLIFQSSIVLVSLVINYRYHTVVTEEKFVAMIVEGWAL